MASVSAAAQLRTGSDDVNGTAAAAKQARLVSLDALRGFDMFWIIGAREIVRALATIGFPGSGIFLEQLTHSGWNGFNFYDLVFPLFIFVVGVSLVLALSKRLERGENRGTILRHVATRTVLLFFLGIIYNGGFRESFSDVRVMGVLQRVALCYFVASTLVLWTSIRTQAVVSGFLLVGYYLLMRFVPVPNYGAGVWTPEGNLARFIDSIILPGQPYWATWDPEGLVSTFPAIATCLMGVLAGHWMRAKDGLRGLEVTPTRKAQYLFGAGVAAVAFGLLIGLAFPINKSMWTSSFALLTGGLSAALFALFYWLIDVRGYRKWAFPFVVIGLNSIFIYLASSLIPFDDITQRLVGGDISGIFGRGRVFFESTAQLLLEWLVLFWMYRRKIFIRL